ncbi:MAG: helicase-associated domain-containing protein [Ktedonobacterales bacterium]
MTTRDASNDHTADPLAGATRFQRDLYLYWHIARTTGGVPLTTRGYVARPALRRIRARLFASHTKPETSQQQPDTPEAEDASTFFLRRLLERLGLLRATPDKSRLLAVDHADMARYVALPLSERLRICARLWVAGGWWPDRLDPRAEPPRLMVPAPPRVALARRRLLHDLAVGDSHTRLRIPAHSTLQPSATSRRKASTARHAAPPRALAAPQNESELQRAALLGPLAWLGFVALEAPPAAGGDAPTRLDAVAYHTTPAAAILREPTEGNTPTAGDAHDAVLAEQHGRVIIQPNFAIIAYPPLTAPELLTLDICATEESFERAASYQLTRASIVQARQYGYDIMDLRQQLESLSGSPLPTNVSTTLADWARQAERVRLSHNVTLLEVTNTTLLDALLADRAAARWIERRLTPTTALLTEEAVAATRAWLLRRGELPASLSVTPASALASEQPGQL